MFVIDENDYFELGVDGAKKTKPFEIVHDSAATRLGWKLDPPFMTLSFMGLSAIPELKLTDQGLVDRVNVKLTNVVAG